MIWLLHHVSILTFSIFLETDDIVSTLDKAALHYVIQIISNDYIRAVPTFFLGMATLICIVGKMLKDARLYSSKVNKLQKRCMDMRAYPRDGYCLHIVKHSRLKWAGYIDRLEGGTIDEESGCAQSGEQNEKRKTEGEMGGQCEEIFGRSGMGVENECDG